MSKNLTWSVMKNIFRKINVTRTHYLLREFNRFKHTDVGYGGPTQNPMNIDYREVKSYKQFLNESKTGPNAAVSGLMKTLKVTKESAKEVVKNWTIFGTLSTMTIIHNDDLLREAGTNKSTLRENMYALADTTANLRRKIKALQSIDLEFNSAISLFQLPVMTLLEFAYITECDRTVLTHHKNRILYLSNKLNTGIHELCVVICHAPYMLNMPIVKLIDVTEYLTECGMLGQHIVNDFIIYRYSLSKIKERVSRGLRAEISPLKPWIVRCSISIIEKAEARLHSRQTIFRTSNTLAEYISRELDCDIAAVDALIKRDPTVESINVETLSLLLKLYRDCGYSIGDIYRVPRSLHSHPETVKKRYEIWMEHSPEQPSLFVLVGSKKVFNTQLNRIGKI